jgi:thioredoxin 1
MAKTITDANFEQEVLQSDLPVMVDFWAEWCGPCKTMGPLIDELAIEYEGKVKIVKVNVDESPESPGKFGVMSIPNFIMFKGGNQVNQFIGVKSKDEVKQELDALL